jgi:hypothetical protein
MGYETDIIKTLAKLGKANGTINPDSKSNTGALLGEAFMWDRVEAYARNRSEAAWAALAKEGLIPDKKTLDPGDHQLAQSPNFAVFARVTQPVKRFSGDELANLLAKSKYKVPISTTKEMIDQAKVPTSSMVSLKVVERG